MADTVLKNVLNNRIELNLLFQWLSKPPTQENEEKHNKFSQFTCSQCEFISYFLNYIHEEASSFDKFNESPQKVHTPKSIRKVTPVKSETKIKRRPALFSETKRPHDTSPKLYKNHEQDFNASPNTSTPKNNRLSGNKNLLSEINCANDVSYTSPVSPIYSQLNLTTPRGKTEKGFCLGDFITHKKSSAKKKTPKICSENVEPQESEARKCRRINPTNLNQKFNNFNACENSFNFITDDGQNFKGEDRFKIATRKMNSEPIVRNLKEIKADLNLVTFQCELERLVAVYVHFLGHNFVLNVTSEMYFIISLLLAKQYENIDFQDGRDVSLDTIFTSVHNMIYFAVKTLENQLEFLGVLEKSCIKLLMLNERVKTHSKLLESRLSEIYNAKLESVSEISDERDFHVCFMSDTDNRENFPSETSFHAFRKQRDLFYEILRIWEIHHLSDGWNFAMALGGKIKTLIGLHSDAANFRHFAKLFKSQLLTTCEKEDEEGISENQFTFFSSLPNINSEKLNRLKSRLVMKTSSNGINAIPTFCGQQEFYKEFIVSAATHIFNVHLKDAFIQGILQFNESTFSSNELEELGVDIPTKKSYLICVKSLRLLAKFLGFIEALPYKRSNNSIPEKITSVEIKTRFWEQPRFDIQSVLKASISNQTLILTIPWITKYLSMLDYTTLRLAYYERLHEMLFKIFYNSSQRSDGTFLIKLCLGWLFELPHFPSELYFVWCSKNAHHAIKTPKKPNLDASNIVDKDVIYTCCPYLNEFKKLLQHNCTKHGAITVKHITPITAVELPTQLRDKRLKLQLEEAFLNAQPISMRKTVEFVSERVASACVKTICNKLVPEEKENSLKLFKAFLHADSSTKLNKLDLQAKCNEFMQGRLKRLQTLCLHEMERQVGTKVPESIKLLLSEEELKQTADACVTIASRICTERVQQWINSHVNAGAFNRDFDAELVRVLNDFPAKEPKNAVSSTLPPTGRSGNHDNDSESAVVIVENIRLTCVDVIESPSTINEERVRSLIHNSEHSFENRCDINDTIWDVINRLILDLFILLIAHKTSCGDATMGMFVEFWHTRVKCQKDLFKTVICPRNVTILNCSENRANAWKTYTNFVCVLLKEDLLTCDAFESQCLAIFQQNWDGVVLKQFSRCFQGIVDEYSKNNINSTKFTFLLSFLSDFCSDLDFQY